jgi:hypothetical protein
MTTSSFTKKRIQVWLTLGQGAFGEGKGNTKIIDGLRVDCMVEKSGHPSKNKCKLRIYGMLEHDMTELTQPEFAPLAVRKNLIKVFAGDVDPLPVAYAGNITGAWAVYHSPPNLYFHIEALEGYYPAVAPAPAKSYSGATDVSSVMKRLAAEMGYEFEDGGVSTMIASPYLSGSAYQQASQLAEAANLEFGIDDGTLFIAPRGAPRGGASGNAVLLSPSTGLKGYPVLGKKGLSLECLYNPTLKLGGLVKVESMLPATSGVWRVTALHHHLESEHPGGKWLSKLKTARVTGASSTSEEVD